MRQQWGAVLARHQPAQTQRTPALTVRSMPPLPGYTTADRAGHHYPGITGEVLNQRELTAASTVFQKSTDHCSNVPTIERHGFAHAPCRSRAELIFSQARTGAFPHCRESLNTRQAFIPILPVRTGLKRTPEGIFHRAFPFRTVLLARNGRQIALAIRTGLYRVRFKRYRAPG